MVGGESICVCSAVSYFSTRVGSIIGAGWLSFRVRDGSGRFPAAMAAVTLFFWGPLVFWGCFGGGVGVWLLWCGCGRLGVCYTVLLQQFLNQVFVGFVGCCKFSAG